MTPEGAVRPKTANRRQLEQVSLESKFGLTVPDLQTHVKWPSFRKKTGVSGRTLAMEIENEY
jgi:hypothetical protein